MISDFIPDNPFADDLVPNDIFADEGIIGETPIERDSLDHPYSLKRSAKINHLLRLRREKAEQIAQPVAAGESLHIVSNGSFDYWNFAPIYASIIGYNGIEFFGSTWTLSRANMMSMFDLFDRGVFRSIHMLTGVYFKRRETSIYAQLLTGLQRRKQHFVCFENHTKIMLLGHEETDQWYVLEGSANFNANPRAEQTVISNDRELYEFHRTWMLRMFDVHSS